MVRPQTQNGKSLADVESQRKLLSASSGWSSDDDSEIEFDASRSKLHVDIRGTGSGVLEKPLSIKAKPNTRQKPQKSRCARTEASLATILGFSVIVIFLLMGTLGWMYLKHLTVVCMLTTCIQSSAHITEVMNLTVPPCDDFYNFSCGSFAGLHPLLPNEASSSWFKVIHDRNDIKIGQILRSPDAKLNNKTSTAIQKMKVVYRSCMDEKLIAKSGVNPLTRLIKKHGGWTITKNLGGTKWDKKKYNLTQVVIDAHHINNYPLFKMAVAKDQKKDAYVVEFQQHGLTFSDDKFYTGNSKSTFRSAMLTFGAEFAKLTGTTGKDDIKAVVKKFADIFDFEVEIAKLYSAREAINDPWRMYNLMTVDDLKENFNNMIDLDVYLAAMFGRRISGTTKLLVSFPDYFTKLSALVKKTKTETITNYIMWQIVESVLSYLPKSFREAHVRLLGVKSGVSTPSERSKFCGSVTGKLFGFALSALYVKDYTKEEALKTGKTIVHYLRESLRTQIGDLKWMDEPTKKEALIKLDGMGLAVGYPDWILDQEKLDEHYNNMTVSDQFIENCLNDGVFTHERVIAKYGTKPDPTEWHMYPYEQNAYYSLTMNRMVVPIGLMELPFLDLRAPMAVNFGSLGMFIGHEMTHGFDVRGRNYDKNGKLKHWWTDSVLGKFKNLSNCVMDAYGKYEEFGVKLNSKYTVNENIADDGGLKIALNAYEKWANDHGTFKRLPGLDYSPEQLFYIGFGQTWCTSYRAQKEKTLMLTSVHPPHSIRVRGAISNSKKFAQIFSCKDNSPMNPNKKCDVWGS
ncbi:endothelin-converting enzyme 1-like isoform X2 [Lineus longissimus]|uniref:endothelin-converting enzyme 1-like isoform X2 n=1 Tax=Lineus longissimus TaxID=88925 RepID=UPI002B4E72F6